MFHEVDKPAIFYGSEVVALYVRPVLIGMEPAPEFVCPVVEFD